MQKPRTRDSVKAARVKKTAEICRVSTVSVYRVLRGDQDNDTILTTYQELKEGEACLVQSIKQLTPTKANIR